MKYCEATLKILSIAASSNRGHSQVFIRNNSSHEAVLELVENFADFLETLFEVHIESLPDYFQTGIEKLEILQSDESDLIKKDKMEASYLANQLKKYIKLDVFGFNSSECF